MFGFTLHHKKLNVTLKPLRFNRNYKKDRNLPVCGLITLFLIGGKQ